MRVPRHLIAAAAVALLLAPAASAAPPPALDAQAWMLFAPGRGGVLVSHEPDSQRPVASLVKLMTARLALRSGRLDEVATVSQRAAVAGASGLPPYLQAGQRVRLSELVTTLVVHSSNAAAVAIAEHLAGSEEAFAERMNAEARKLGLRGTAYRNSHGLDAAGQHSDARDVLVLALADMRDPRFRRAAGMRVGRAAGLTFANTNNLIGRYAGAAGVKTGHTNSAGWNLAAAAQRGPVTLFAVVLGAGTEDGRDRDVARLLDWGFDRFSEARLVRRGQRYGGIDPGWGRPEVPAVAARGLRAVVRQGQKVRARVVLRRAPDLPIEQGAPLGRVELRAGRMLLGSVPLVAGRAEPEPSLVDQVRWLGSRTLDGLRGLSPF